MKTRVIDIKDKKLGYYVVPKCGSRTVVAWQLIISQPNLIKDNPSWFDESKQTVGYRELNKMIVLSKHDFPIKFCIVRDPVDRFLSAFTNRVLFHKLNPVSEINDVIQNFDAKINNLEYKDLDHHTKPLKHWLGTNPNIFNYIFNLGEMDKVKKLIEETCDVTLPNLHLQKSGNIKKPTLNTDQINWIKERYRSDYELYGRWF